ncbi:hypothetical protein NVP1155O_37 [Vibrio phage 1.155.O._10N.222.55.B3]|nr:hypothetical protein NVP1155O_37 [Vibrio phage 1.155.O._10N.222.55.B3]
MKTHPTHQEAKIRIDHVKVEESIFDLRSDFESNLLCSNNGTDKEPMFIVIRTTQALAIQLAHNNVYRRIECEASEQDEFTDALLEIGADCTSFTQLARTLYQSGRFKLVEGVE